MFPITVSLLSLTSFVTTVICILLGYPAAYIISRLKSNSQAIMVLIITIPMLINMLVRTYAWRGLLSNINISTDLKVYIGMVYNFLPYMILEIYTSLSKIDNSLIAAANDLGCDDVKTFLKVTLPLSTNNIWSTK